MFSTLSQSNWKICQAPKLMMPMFSLPIIVTPAVIMTQLGKLLTFILMPTQIRYQKLQTTLIPTQWTLLKMILTIMATLTEILVNLMRYQVQLYNNLSDYCLLSPSPPLRSANPCHHSSPPFSDVPTLPSHSVTQPVFTEAMLMDTINGTIHLRDLPLCVRTSATISAFCINTLADPPELNIIRGLDKHFIHHILRTSYAITCISTN
ncbi:hypothetical protein MHU86_6089 [Fragilaria crotonensis]|nr:hypothetical protein MHU86_6089 [Fragilaria crotonensis]